MAELLEGVQADVAEVVLLVREVVAEDGSDPFLVLGYPADAGIEQELLGEAIIEEVAGELADRLGLWRYSRLLRWFRAHQPG